MTDEKQPVDNPEVESEDGQAEIQESQPKQELIEVNGQMLTMDELKNGYMRQSDYTKKTMELSNLRKSSQPQPVNEEDKLIQDFIQQNGLLTKQEAQELLEKNKKLTQDEIEFERYRSQHNPTEAQMRVVKNLGYTQAYANLPWHKIHEEVYGEAATTKVVGRKVVGQSTKTGSKMSSKLTRADIANMSDAEYAKKTPQQWMALVSE